ncbi:hypothetical protein V1520DRAFT_343755 [Lipomyces starkeyi]|uniref:DUF7707 domain-containing protein n=1 Tax=Lipomyces starkeyi NRRL Y-11557 TaxID=675824 RepID=A0A1E3Q5G5_LIPST|nr:hypothetical protein LIPSTDRAFT_112249 [Lipomyces starkeyi NRRL Y-11557]
MTSLSMIFLPIVALLLATTALAQTYPTFNASIIDPNTRLQWCQSEVATCPLICLDEGYSATSNLCYPDNLYYICQCSNGHSPNLTEYSLTIPYFVCQEQVTLCANNCGSDNTCVSACRQNKQCGATNPTRVNVSSTSTAVHSTASSSLGSSLTTVTSAASSAVAFNGFGTTAVQGASPTKNAAAAMFDNRVDVAGLKAAVWLVATVVAGVACGLAL